MSKSGKLLFKKLSPHASTPLRQNSSSAGFDLFSAEYKVVQPLSTLAIKTDISMTLPYGSYGRITAKSSLTNQHSLTALGGIFDSDCSENLTILLFNHGRTEIVVDMGMKIAQLIVEKIYMPELIEVQEDRTSSDSWKNFEDENITCCEISPLEAAKDTYSENGAESV